MLKAFCITPRKKSIVVNDLLYVETIWYWHGYSMLYIPDALVMLSCCRATFSEIPVSQYTVFYFIE